MPDTKILYFYVWQHRFVDSNDAVQTRTCFGLTSNPLSRCQSYEGHVGHDVKFLALWSGPERLIRELESRLKRDFHEHLFVGAGGYRYEWVTESVPTEHVLAWVQWEIEHTFTGINAVTEHAQLEPRGHHE
jgi:hypothetical protein